MPDVVLSSPLAEVLAQGKRVLHVDGQECTLGEVAFVDMFTLRGNAADNRFVQAVHRQWPDAIVNNASLFEPDTGLDFSPELLQQQMQVNLVAPLHLATLLARAVQQAPAGRPTPAVVHVLDQKVFNLNPDYFSYTLTKLALERAVALQAQALAPQVRVSAVAPGLIYVSGPQTGDNFHRASTVNLLRSPTDPADVARTAVFLAENASITGITITVDKGQHLVPLERDIMFVAEQLAQAAPPGIP